MNCEPLRPFDVGQERESKIVGSIVAAALEKLEEFAPVKLVFFFLILLGLPSLFCPRFLVSKPR